MARRRGERPARRLLRAIGAVAAEERLALRGALRADHHRRRAERPGRGRAGVAKVAEDVLRRSSGTSLPATYWSKSRHPSRRRYARSGFGRSSVTPCWILRTNSRSSKSASGRHDTGSCSHGRSMNCCALSRNPMSPGHRFDPRLSRHLSTPDRPGGVRRTGVADARRSQGEDSARSRI